MVPCVRDGADPPHPPAATKRFLDPQTPLAGAGAQERGVSGAQQQPAAGAPGQPAHRRLGAAQVAGAGEGRPRSGLAWFNALVPGACQGDASGAPCSQQKDKRAKGTRTGAETHCGSAPSRHVHLAQQAPQRRAHSMARHACRSFVHHVCARRACRWRATGRSRCTSSTPSWGSTATSAPRGSRPGSQPRSCCRCVLERRARCYPARSYPLALTHLPLAPDRAARLASLTRRSGTLSSCYCAATLTFSRSRPGSGRQSKRSGTCRPLAHYRTALQAGVRAVPSKP